LEGWEIATTKVVGFLEGKAKWEGQRNTGSASFSESTGNFEPGGGEKVISVGDG